jgi:hypothetical protein
VAQVVDSLPNKFETLSSISTTTTELNYPHLLMFHLSLLLLQKANSRTLPDKNFM